MADDSLFHLSAREVELTELVACGYSNQEIAQRLFLSRDTVKTHLKRVFGKCGFRNRVELASWWDSQRAGETSREAAIDKPPGALATHSAIAPSPGGGRFGPPTPTKGWRANV